MKEMSSLSQPIGQNMMKVISNLCFSFFVFAVFVFVVIAITYQPPDPWLESAPALTKLFTQTENPTFRNDNSVLQTGEDLPASSDSFFITDETVPNMTVRSSECHNSLHVVNCSDPAVFLAVEKFNLNTFRSIVFLDYQAPVRGSKPDECDVAWKFRSKKEKSWRSYGDFRRFRFAVGDGCAYDVLHAGGWHSGVNSRKQPRIKHPLRDHGNNHTTPRPSSGPQSRIRRGKYLYYSRGGDYCKGMNQYAWSFLCGLGEAMYLNRTFVMDLSICLAGSYNPSGNDEEGKDFRFYFDYEHLKEVASVVEEGEFLRDWKSWDRSHKKKIPVRKIPSFRVSPAKLKRDSSVILWRQFDGVEPENYWYRVCEGDATKYIKRPWDFLWKSKRLMNIVASISGGMDWDFDAVHVVRGEKAGNKKLWPRLDADTSPDSLLAKLQTMIHPWRNLYIATNEPFYNYFDKLRSLYRVHMLDDYEALWGNKSDWHNDAMAMALNNGRPVEFDGFMRVVVDTELLYRAKTRVETFYNLTGDCKDGINTC